jgi:hypothetical protein
MMDKIEEARAFYEAHKKKIGRDFRLEFLKLSKEDIYDYLDNIDSDKIHGWREKLWETENREKRLISQFDKLKAEHDAWMKEVQITFGENRELKLAMQEFVDRVDKGEIRSKYTYTKFKELLNK